MRLKVNIPESIKEVNINNILKESLVRFGDMYNKPNPMIVVLDGVKEFPYLNYAGISAVFGEQKSRKTFYLSNVMACAVGNTIIDERMRAYTSEKNHLWFDTEQSKYYVSRIPYRVVKKLGKDKHPDNLQVYSIKRYRTDDRMRFIEYMIDKTENIGLVIIDGLRDLVHDFNNLAECTDLVNNIMNWVDTKNCHICSVLHINPLHKGDDKKPRGHLGTELQNKIESSILIQKCKENPLSSIIKPRDFRDLGFEPFMLGIDADYVPYFYDKLEDIVDEPPY